MCRRLVRFWSGAVLSVCTILLFVPSSAEEGYPAARRRFGRNGASSDCQLQSGGESAVLAVAAPQILHLADGRFVRLAEVLVPAAVPIGFDPSAAASAFLRQFAVGRKVEVKFGGNQRDRYGVYTGHVFVAGEPPVWLQEGLVKSGFAQAFPQADNHACARKLLAIEAEARSAARGHWGLAVFKILPARDPRAILNLLQTYQVVEGKVAQATESGGRVTLHFAEPNKFGFAATLEPSAKKTFADKPDANSWDGVEIRVRGWIERRRGPSITVTQPEQIEVSARDSGAVAKESQPRE